MRRSLSAILVLVLGITAAVPVLADSADAVQSTEPAAVSAADTPVDVNTEAVYLAGNPEDVAVVILHTNDAHTYYQNNIGYDGLALYKKELESQYDNVLLVDAGDTIQGTSIGTVSKGSAPVEMMNHLGYDLAVPGNHDRNAVTAETEPERAHQLQNGGASQVLPEGLLAGKDAGDHPKAACRLRPKPPQGV